MDVPQPYTVVVPSCSDKVYTHSQLFASFDFRCKSHVFQLEYHFILILLTNSRLAGHEYVTMMARMFHLDASLAKTMDAEWIVGATHDKGEQRPRNEKRRGGRSR
jgi:hypothetical protein